MQWQLKLRIRASKVNAKGFLVLKENSMKSTIFVRLN